MNIISEKKKTILVLTDNYPRFKGCATAPFVGVLVKNLAKHSKMIVLAPRHKWAVAERSGVKLEYFKYSFRSWEQLSYIGNLFAKVVFRRAKMVIAVWQSVREHVVDIAPRVKVI